MFTTSPIFGLDEDFSGSRSAVGDVPRLLQLSRGVLKRTTGCSQVLVHEHLVTSTCVVVLQLEPGAVHVIPHLLTGESDDDGPVTRFAVLIHLWSKTVASLDLMAYPTHFVVDYFDEFVSRIRHDSVSRGNQAISAPSTSSMYCRVWTLIVDSIWRNCTHGIVFPKEGVIVAHFSTNNRPVDQTSAQHTSSATVPATFCTQEL